MLRLLIIGYGNPLRGDDGFGFQAACRLQSIAREGEIEVVAQHQLTPELMDPISRAQQVIFIDASETGEPGVLEERPIDPAPQAGSFTHHATPAGLLSGARILFGHAPSATLFSVRGEDFSYSEELTEPVARALEELVTRIQAEHRT